jgi:hypothetical protein
LLNGVVMAYDPLLLAETVFRSVEFDPIENAFSGTRLARP